MKTVARNQKSGIRSAGLLLAFAVATVQAQYTIDWSTIDGGGYRTNDQSSVSGIVGQYDASGSLTSGNYALTGGFWAIYALQTPGAPLLTVFATTTNTVVVSRPSSATNSALEQNTNLTAMNWTLSSHLRTTTNIVVVSWSSAATNFVLEQNTNLATTNWTLSSYSITTSGGIRSITITSSPQGNLFFRLRQ